MKRIFFIDIENVGNNGLKRIESLVQTDKLILFHGQHYHSERVSDKIMNHLRAMTGEVEIVSLQSYTKNAMDFQIVAYLGYLVGLNEAETKYYIVSGDTGYDAAIEFFHNKMPHVSIERIPSVGESIDREEVRKQVEDILSNYAKKAIKVTTDAICATKNLKDFHNYLNSKLRDNGEKIYPLVKDLFMNLHHIEVREVKGEVKGCEILGEK